MCAILCNSWNRWPLFSEGFRELRVSRNQVPLTGLWVRIPCPPLDVNRSRITSCIILISVVFKTRLYRRSVNDFRISAVLQRPQFRSVKSQVPRNG
jgi:hypothetical protein